ncbi:MAG: HAD family hydrolase [Rickettsiales bacterium]
MSLPKPRAILFDWDNTLVDTWPLIHEALNMTLRHMEHPEWSFAKVRGEVKKSMRDAFPGLFGERWEVAAEHYQNSYRSIHLERLTALADAEATLRAIPRSEIFVGLVSNKKGDALRKELTHLGWDHLVDIAIGAGDAATDKPTAAPVLLALQGTTLKPGPDMWFVGDTGIDLETAKNTGCTAILYGDHVTDAGSFEGFPFTVHARDHVALAAIITEAMRG